MLRVEAHLDFISFVLLTVSCLDGGDDEQRPREKRRKGQKRKRSDGGDDKEEYDEEDSHPYTLRKRYVHVLWNFKHRYCYCRKNRN